MFRQLNNFGLIQIQEDDKNYYALQRLSSARTRSRGARSFVIPRSSVLGIEKHM
jgi:hypothetical protein